VGQDVECLKPIAVPLPPGTLSQGTPLFNLEIGDPRASSINSTWVRTNSGHLFALDMCGIGGVISGTYQNWIQSSCTQTCPGGSPFVANIGDRVPLRYNQIPDPTRLGLGSLISGDSNGATFNYDVTNYPNLPGSNDYNGDNWILSPRVTRVVLYDPNVVADPTRQTDTRIPVWGFAGFWIERLRSTSCYCTTVCRRGRCRTVCRTCWSVDGYFIPDSAVGGTTPPPTSIEPSLKTVRLVQ
jgi:hypothetical protein